MRKKRYLSILLFSSILLSACGMSEKEKLDMIEEKGKSGAEKLNKDPESKKAEEQRKEEEQRQDKINSMRLKGDVLDKKNSILYIKDETISIGDYKYKIDNIAMQSTMKIGDEIKKAPEGKTYVTVAVRVTNNTSENLKMPALLLEIEGERFQDEARINEREIKEMDTSLGTYTYLINSNAFQEKLGTFKLNVDNKTFNITHPDNGFIEL
ncbi:hypothetical protein CN931_14510 [Bacillus sp. AFS054943]|uniref:DUF4352 domain-containing protein n=1 Tax=Bacillus cereus TaxID=1396 RepID=A0A2C1LNE9_BACCE|nr:MULTISPECIES: hypothetical protein [Bacillus]MBE7122937.1 DUF4352 domain-containing protein [Bacillus cereus]PGL82613.1 hypothetical protein CN931_14510 [Bacillus sp. AFS054943]PGT99408.1 hypothetical protein COD19_18975 [Bacillus cereus]